VEDKAIKLGHERTRLEGDLAKTIEQAVELMGDAERSGVSIERLAELIRISRPTVYRWRDNVAILRADRAEQGATDGNSNGPMRMTKRGSDA
jgi:hypothetical protein